MYSMGNLPSRLTSLASSGQADAQAVGGKAANLMALHAAGFPVPAGFVVPVVEYERFLDSNSLRAEIQRLLSAANLDDEKALSECSSRIKSAIASGQMAPPLLEAIASAAAPTAGALWAVRSSAVSEDLAEASFAGQQDTYLSVRPGELAEKTKQCWASYWNERAISYRHKAGAPQLGGGIAVVIQSMVDASSSGVMFTCDPVSGNESSIIVESSWGLGEAIVSGLVTPDRFVIAKGSLDLQERRISRKANAVYLAAPEPAAVEEQRQSAPSITDLQAKELASMGASIETHFGSPQDIEWAIGGGSISILQSRPITTLAKGEETLWTRAYGDEYWSDVTSPLFYSWLGEWLSKYVLEEGYSVMGYWELKGLDLLRLHKGHIYFNAAVLEGVFTFNPRFSRTKELLNYFPEKDQERIANAKTKALRRAWSEVRIAFKDSDGMITKTDKAYRRWASEFLRKMERFDALDLTALSDQALYDEYASMVQAFLKHFRLIRYGMVTHSIGMNLMAKRWLTDWAGDTTGALYASVVSGLPDNKTIMTNNALIVLARSVREDPAIMGAIQSKPAAEFLGELRFSPSMAQFREKFGLFLKEYGHRSHTREMYFPRWADDPALVVDILKSLSAAPDIDVERMERETVAKRLEAEKEIGRRISKVSFGFFKKRIFNIILKFAQTYLIFRENQRFYLDHIISRQRRIFMEYGRRLAGRGIIVRQDDIFFLSKEETFAVAKGELPGMNAGIASRRAEFEKYKDVLPPKFLKGRVEFDDTLVLKGNILKVTGTSASPGVATGPVRVVESIDEIRTVRSGEILVTSNTDPGWTPVFSQLAGLITETGGILSHGAVVSREYGIPAVTAVKGAKQIFKTGQRITVDGNDGVIYLLEE